MRKRALETSDRALETLLSENPSGGLEATVYLARRATRKPESGEIALGDDSERFSITIDLRVGSDAEGAVSSLLEAISDELAVEVSRAAHDARKRASAQIRVRAHVGHRVAQRIRTAA